MTRDQQIADISQKMKRFYDWHGYRWRTKRIVLNEREADVFTAGHRHGFRMGGTVALLLFIIATVSL